MAKIMLKPEAAKRVAKQMGYTGDMRKFPEFLASSAAGQAKLESIKKAARGMVIQAAEGTLIKVPGKKTWYIKEAGKPPIDTGRKKKSDAGKALGAFEAITSNTGTATGEVVKEGNQWSAVIQNADGSKSTVPTGKTNANLAKGLLSKFEKDAPAPAPAAAAPAPAVVPAVVPAAAPAAAPAAPAPAPVAAADPVVTAPVAAAPAAAPAAPAPIGEAIVDRAVNPNLQDDQKVAPTKIEVTEDQLIKEGTGALTGTGAQATTTEGTVTEATAPVQPETSTVDPTLVGDTLPKATAVQGTVAPEAVIDPREQTETALSDMEAVQGTANTVENAPVREVQEGELDISSTVDMNKVADTFGRGELKAASVQDELESLMSQYDGGNVPAFGAPMMRKAMAQISARGLSASSMAGQAIIQAMMEASLPIAQLDAASKQEVNILKAKERANFLRLDFDQAFEAKVKRATKISDIADMNFNAEQQVAIENARIASTMNIANLTSRQGMQLAEAAQLAALETTNLNNRQQAEVLNAKNFLDMDMANLDREQATEVFNTQNRVKSMFNDQAATNAAKQFNATSENQTNQFFAGLKTQVDMQNSAAKTGMSQFNAGQKNAASQFNASVQNQRDQFNAQNQMVIAQGNAQWRRAVATGDTAAINRANELNANALLNMSSQAYQNLWQEHADTMERSWKTAENAQERINQLAVISMQGEIELLKADKEAKSNNLGAIGNLVGTILTL